MDVLGELLSQGSGNPMEVAADYYHRGMSVTYVIIGSYAWLMWDWALSFELEWRLIWKQNRTAGKLLFIALRTWAVALQTFDIIVLTGHWSDMKFCKAFYVTVDMGTFIQCFIVQLILQGRVYALYGCDRRVLYLNAALFLVSVISVAGFLSRQFGMIQPIPVPAPFPGCWAVVPRNIAVSFLPPIIYEVWLLILVCIKVYQKAQLYGISTLSGGAVLKLLIRDSFIWFCAASIMLFMNMFAFLFAGNLYNYMGIPFLQSALCIGGCRLMLNIKSTYGDRDEEDRHNADKHSGRGYDAAVKAQMEMSLRDGTSVPSTFPPRASTSLSKYRLDEEMGIDEIDLRDAWYGHKELPFRSDSDRVGVRMEGARSKATSPDQVPGVGLQVHVEIEVEYIPEKA